MIKKAYVDLPVGQIHYRHVPASSGLPIVFLHRAPSSSHSFEPVLKLLAGWRPLVALDTPGFGGSFDPPGEPTIDDFRDWIVAALDVLGVSKFHLCGHHTGTHLAAEIAVKWPDRVRSLLLDGVLVLDADERSAMLANLDALGGPDAEGAYLLKSWNFMKPYYPGAPTSLLHAEIIMELTSLNSRRKCAKVIFTQDMAAILPRLLCPMVITSAEDDVVVSHIDRIRRRWPEIETQITAPAGVASPEMDSTGFAARLRALVERAET